MTGAAPKAIAVSRALDAVMRSDRARLLSVLASRLGDIGLAEDALQDAAMSALSHWGRSGLPASPPGWLLTVARRKAIDRLRARSRDAQKVAGLAQLVAEADEPADLSEIPDHRLRLIFACCHPALELKSRVALTLRTVCGLSTAEIARVFLDAEPTMAQRLSRAKAKIAATGVGFAEPDARDWPARRESVLLTLYLIFTTGYVASGEEPRDLCLEAEHLMRIITRLHPDDAELEGALAMMLLTSARRRARIGPDGASVPPAAQDRALWDASRICEGRALLHQALSRRQPGPFQIKAAIADCHMAEPATDWRQISFLYAELGRYEPTPIVRLNAAVALAEAGEPARALAMIEGLADALAGYQPYFAAYAAVLERCGQTAAAIDAYRAAGEHAPGEAEARFIAKKLAELQRTTG